MTLLFRIRAETTILLPTGILLVPLGAQLVLVIRRLHALLCVLFFSPQGSSSHWEMRRYLGHRRIKPCLFVLRKTYYLSSIKYGICSTCYYFPSTSEPFLSRNTQ